MLRDSTRSHERSTEFTEHRYERPLRHPTQDMTSDDCHFLVLSIFLRPHLHIRMREGGGGRGKEKVKMREGKNIQKKLNKRKRSEKNRKKKDYLCVGYNEGEEQRK